MREIDVLQDLSCKKLDLNFCAETSFIRKNHLSFRYKPVIVFEGISYIATWCMLLWANGVGWMQSMEFAYGIATSTEVAYFTYIYAKVSLF